MQTIQVNGREVEYKLRQGNSRRYVTLKFLLEDELEIILPRERTIDVEALLKKKSSLIERKHSEFLAHQKILNEEQEAVRKDKLLLFGKFYDVEVYTSEKYAISLDDSKVRIRMPKLSRSRQEYEYLRKWIRGKLLETLINCLRVYERSMKAPIGKFYIKNQKTRWASYSPKRNIHFNIKLAALPKRIIEYIVIHELAHATQSNHNRKFWYIVEKFCPDYKKRRQELKEYSLVIQKSRIWQKMLGIYA